jgi:putative ABC transport system substrate-binding protein
MYTVPSWVREGGLLGYAQDDRALAGKAAALANRILRGAEPASLPVEEPTTFVFAVNLVTARSLGITIPSDVLLQATDVIQ